MMNKLLLLIILCFILSTNTINGQTNNFKTITFNSLNLKDFIGIGGDFSLFSSDQVSQQITFLKELDYIGWVRIGIDFDEFEPTEGVFNLDRFDPPMRQVNASGLNTIVYFTGVPSWLAVGGVSTNNSYPIDNTKFANTLVSLAKNYTFVKYWQVWDNANVIPTGSNEYSAIKYKDLFLAVSNEFELNDISSKLSIGSVYGYGKVIVDTVTSATDNMVTDLIASNIYNGYLSSFKPFTVNAEGNKGDTLSTPTSHYEQSKSLISNLKQQGSSPSVFATSWGWSSFGDNEMQQANFTVKRLILDTITGIDKTFISSISDLDANSGKPVSDRLYGIVNLQLSKKLVYRVLERLFQITGPSLLAYPTPTTAIEFVNYQDGMIFIFYKKPSGTSSTTTLVAFYKVALEGVDNSNTTSVTIKNIDNGGNKGLVGYLYSPIFIQQSYTMVSFNNVDNNNSITVPVSFDLTFLEFPLAPPKNNTSSSSSSDDVSMSFKLTINNMLIICVLSLLSILQL